MHEQPSYYSILTANVRYDKRLRASEKVFFSEITALSNKYGYCTASNRYFANLYEVSKDTVSTWVSDLVKLGYVKREEIRSEQTKEVIERRLYPVATPPIDKKADRYSSKDREGIDKKVDTPIGKKAEENNTSLNITSINREKGEEVNQQEDVNIFDFLPSCGIYMSAINQTVLIDYAKKINQEVLIHAAKYTSEHATRPNFAYFRSILESYLQANIKTLTQAEAFDAKTEQQRNRSYNRKPTNKSKWGGQLNEYDVTF
ncbi:helix-turn-helix domain-containing protein [Ligilactobacillus agilis]|uniref:helix-turn-helix domain-containing protein n=1 Tax=Ligilactobacillus agilis TaxID=1601 RepID=UPI001F593483|nr:helix-turn-helix domain-containing protein [Ligilactobacillus agilis]UNL43178.1 DnaD domain protein [Ligilactobacillus agilis]UNL57826.1 DnaD domain protein [Ligilactobacillus agilis]